MFKCLTQKGLNTVLKTELLEELKKNEEFQGFEASVGEKKLRLDWDWIEDGNMMIS